MVLDQQRQNVDPLLTVLARPFKRLSADTLSWIALLMSFLAGFFFYLSNPTNEANTYYLFFASLFVVLNGLFDAIDGKVAKMTNTASARGDFLDHALDRFADVFIVGGLALSTWIRPEIGLLAIVGMLLTSYMGTQSQAVGAKRNYGGLLGRADRLILLILFPLLQHMILHTPYQDAFPYQLTVLELVLIYFAIVGNITALQRFLSTLHWFKQHADDR